MSRKQAGARTYKRGRFERTEPTTLSRLGHPIWDADLDSVEVLKRFKSGKELQWGIILRVLEPGWEPLEEVHIPGQDWSVLFLPPKSFRVPIVSGPLATSKPRWTSFKHPTALLRVAADGEDLNHARDRGAKLVRSLAGLLQTHFNIIVASEPLWEGAITLRKQRRVSFMASGRQIGVEGVTRNGLHQRGLELAPFRLSTLPRHLASSLRWYGLAWSSPGDDRAAQFIHFWLAALALIQHGSSGGTQRQRIEQYIGSMILSPQRESELVEALWDSYKIRLEIVHECRDDSVTLASLERLQKAALELIDFEKGQSAKGTS